MGRERDRERENATEKMTMNSDPEGEKEKEGLKIVYERERFDKLSETREKKVTEQRAVWSESSVFGNSCTKMWPFVLCSQAQNGTHDKT